MLDIGQTNKRGYGGSGDMGDSLGTISHIKLSQGAFRGNPPVSLVPPVSLLAGFPGFLREARKELPGPALLRNRAAPPVAKGLDRARELPP